VISIAARGAICAISFHAGEMRRTSDRRALRRLCELPNGLRRLQTLIP